jgi:hypothetical protein
MHTMYQTKVLLEMAPPREAQAHPRIASAAAAAADRTNTFCTSARLDVSRCEGEKAMMTGRGRESGDVDGKSARHRLPRPAVAAPGHIHTSSSALRKPEFSGRRSFLQVSQLARNKMSV